MGVRRSALWAMLPYYGGKGESMSDEEVSFNLELLSRMAKDIEDAKACLAREYPGVPQKQVDEVKSRARELIEICGAFLKALDVVDEIERAILEKTKKDLGELG